MNNKEKLKICYWPFSNRINKYIDINLEILESMGHKLICADEDIQKMFQADVVFLSWFEGIFGQDKKSLENVYKSKVRLIQELKRRNIKIFVVFHNVYPHDISGLCLEYTTDFIKFLYQICEQVIIFNNASKKYLKNYLTKKEIETKTTQINHPNYINAYPNWEIIHRNKINNQFKILFFGAIRKYKNINLVLELAKKMKDCNVKFTIAGPPLDPQYATNILIQSKELDNVDYIPKEMVEDEVSAIIKLHDILIMPYDKKSCLNSGVFFLASSYGKTVICPNLACVEDYDSSLIYKYKYYSDNKHFKRLYKTTEKAYRDWNNNSENFYQKGLKFYKLVKLENSIDYLKDQYKLLFSKFF